MLSKKERAKLKKERKYLNNLLNYPIGTYSERFEDIVNSMNKERKNSIIFRSVGSIISCAIFVITVIQTDLFAKNRVIGWMALLSYCFFIIFSAGISVAIERNTEREAKEFLDSIAGYYVYQRLEKIEKKLNASEK